MVLVVLVVADVAQVLLAMVLRALQQAADLLALGLVLPQQVHRLR